MLRRELTATLSALLVLAPFPAWSQVGRITLEAPVAPAPTFAAGGAMNTAMPSPAALTGLTPGLTLSFAPVLSAPAAQPLFKTVPIAAVEPPRPVARIAPSFVSANDAHFTPIEVLTKAAATPETIGRLFDAAPSAPDLEALATVKIPASPAAWTPTSAFLKPAAFVVNAVRLSRHEKRLISRMPEERVTTEEMSMQETLTTAHAAISKGLLQDALDGLTSLFKGRGVNGWYRANPMFQPYQSKGHEYLRFVERAVKLAYERAHARAGDEILIAESFAAKRAGGLLGHTWRATAIQERDSAHCAHNALFNAITASAGFASFISVRGFVERARELLNTKAETLTNTSGADLAALESSLGIKFGVDVGEGMGAETIGKWAQMLGLSFEARGPPKGDAGWSALLRGGRSENLLSLRMFHERFKHTREEAALHGHNYKLLYHEVYLLGAFDSPSRGARLYMVQDSGSGATDFYTAEELSAVVSDLQIVTPKAPVALP
jgi:hypothetical protein